MDRSPVKSSNVASVGYEPSTKTMEVEFKDGSIYHYHGVESTIHSDLVSSKSIGKFLHANVKGQYKHSKI